MMNRSLAMLMLGTALTSTAHAEGRVLEMDQALETAQQHAPELIEAEATLRAAQARVGTARAPLLPQVTGTAQYTRGTYNFARGTTSTTGASYPIDKSEWDTRNSFSVGLRASQLIYDFGQQWALKDVALHNAEAEEFRKNTTILEIAYGVRSAFLDAGKYRALVEVAQATLANQQRHLDQIQGFVDVGTRPLIDLAQSKTDVASAKLSLLQAQNNYASAIVQLSRNMGTPSVTDFDVSTALPPAEIEEDASVEELMKQGEAQRPEFQAFKRQVEAQEASERSIRGQYGPTLSLVGSADLTGLQVSALVPNISVGAALNWPFYQGGLTNSRLREAQALTAQVHAQLETLRQDLRVAVSQSSLSIRATRAALAVADDLVQLAKDRQALAEGRYQAGVGNRIELGDAELALRDAQTQRVSAEYDLALARALLHRTLGRP